MTNSRNSSSVTVLASIGSSTGGFTEVLLEEGAVHVCAVDVGSDQLHPTLLKNPKVESIENTDIRKYDPEKRFDLVVSDVSFISLLHILDDVDRLASRWIILLFKPQFEVGKDVKRDSKGVVQDVDAIARRKEEFEAEAVKLGWELKYQTLSKVQGKEGNQEYLFHFVKN